MAVALRGGWGVNPSDAIILEGILILHDPRIRDLMNMKIFLDKDADVHLARRIRHNTAERDIGMILDQCFDFANYMDINSRRPSRRCPHCNQYSRIRQFHPSFTSMATAKTRESKIGVVAGENHFIRFQIA